MTRGDEIAASGRRFPGDSESPELINRCRRIRNKKSGADRFVSVVMYGDGCIDDVLRKRIAHNAPFLGRFIGSIVTVNEDTGREREHGEDPPSTTNTGDRHSVQQFCTTALAQISSAFHFSVPSLRMLLAEVITRTSPSS